MKYPLLCALISFTFLLSGCTKIFDHSEQKIRGSWRLKIAERLSFLSWKTLDTGYEDGKFTFQDNGDANYEEPLLIMNGNWRISLTNNNWYNENGNGNTQQRELSINLYNFALNKTLNLDFSSFHFKTRNHLVAEYQSPAYRYRYEFVRY